jgi:hypothetical protein
MRKGLNHNCTVRRKRLRTTTEGSHWLKCWEIIADRLSKAGWSWGWVSAVDLEGRTTWIVDAHRDDGKHFVVRADEKLTAFLELEAEISHAQASAEPVAACQARPYILRSNSASCFSWLFSMSIPQNDKQSAVTSPAWRLFVSRPYAHHSLKSPVWLCVSITLPAAS